MWKCDKCGSDNPDEQEECLSCKASGQTPYYRKSLAEPKQARDQFTVEVNPEERAWLEQLKARWDFKSDSKVLKLCLENAIICKNLALSEKSWRYVLSTSRQRLSQYKKLAEPIPEENAMQN